MATDEAVIISWTPRIAYTLAVLENIKLNENPFRPHKCWWHLKSPTYECGSGISRLVAKQRSSVESEVAFEFSNTWVSTYQKSIDNLLRWNRNIFFIACSHACTLCCQGRFRPRLRLKFRRTVRERWWSASYPKSCAWRLLSSRHYRQRYCQNNQYQLLSIHNENCLCAVLYSERMVV